MSQVKRICAALLAIMMLMSFLTVSAFAATPAGMEVTTDGESIDKLKAGDTITVKFTLPKMDKIQGAEVHLNFDYNKLEYKPDIDSDGDVIFATDFNTAKWSLAITKAATANTDGKIQYVAHSNNAKNISVPDNFNLLTVKFLVRDGASGSVTFSVPLFNLAYIDDTSYPQPITDVTAPSPKTVTISKAPISSVTASVEKPVAGKALDFIGTVDSSAPYSITKVEWFEGTDATGTSVTGPATAKAKQFYYARITLTANSGESFADSVNAPTGYTKVSADATTIVLTKTFPETDSLPPASVTDAPTAKSLKYNGSDQELVNAGTTPDGTMQYSLNNTDWSTTIPKGKDAKTYTVYYKVKGDSGHSDSTVANVKVTIGQKDISGVTIDPIPNQTYNGAAIEPPLVVKDGGTPLVKGTDYTVSCTDNIYVGTNTAKLTITGKGNYTGTKAANFTIVAADQNPTFTTPKDLVKGGAMLDLRTLVQGAKGEMTFTIALGTTSATLSGHTLTSTGIKGEVKVSVSITAKDVNNDGENEYNAFSKSEAITVNVIDKTSDATTMKVSQSNITYGGSVSPSVTNKPADAGTVSYTYEGRDGTTYSNSAAPTNVGKYKVKAKCESSTTIYTAEDDFEILPKSISGMTVTLDKTSLEYNGSAQTVNVTGVGSLTAADYTVTSGNSGTDVGSYTVTVTGNGNYKDTAKATWKITPATLTVTPDANQSKKFKEADPAALTYTFSGNASGQTPAFNGKLDREAGENVGTYAIKLGNLALTDNGTFKASNYTLKLSSPTVNFEIKKTDAPVPTGLKGVKGNELATVVLPTGWEWEASNTKMDNLGFHPFKAKYTDATGNYNNATNVDVTVEVLAKTGVSSSITFPNGSLVYNGHGQEYKKATISGITAGGTPSWTYTYAVDPSTATATLDSGLPLTVGKYKVTAIYEDSANYGTATATLEITQATPTVTPKFDKITEKGQKLSVANLGIGSSSPAGGKIEWVNDAGTALPGDTEVEANKAYKWKYTPADTTNYAPVYGTIVVYPVSTGIVIYSPCYTIKASAGANGTISPAGWCSVVENGSQTFTFTPDKGYTVAKVLVDGKSVGAVKSYTFKDVTKDHTIEVIFMKSNGNPATGVFVMP